MQRALFAMFLTTMSTTGGLTASRLNASETPGDARVAEVARLRAHFDSVDTELRARDVSTLAAAQRANRARLIDWLRDYRDAGAFPRNDYFAVPTPFFRDEHGALCAMGYLIARSGRRDIVDDVARDRNNAYIRELVDDRRLVVWLDSVGLTVAEAARIQPAYGDDRFPISSAEREERVSAGLAIGAIALGGTSLASTAINVVAPRRWSQVLGLAAGAASIGVGAAHLDEGPGAKKVSTATITLGGVSALASVISIMRPAPTSRVAQRLYIAPTLVVMSREDTRPGVLLRARF